MAEIQVYRKLWHMSAVWAPLLYWHAVPRDVALPLAFGALVIAGVIDAIRLNSGVVNDWFFKYLRILIRESERKNLNTATYFILACFLCILFFEKRVAVTAMLFLSLGDPIAAFIGSKYGTIRFFDKSLQGSLACFFTCFFTAQWIMPLPVAFWAALSATVFELLSSRINDNISIPVFSGLSMTLLLRSGPATGAAGYAVIAFKVYLYFVIATSLTGIILRHYLVWRCFRESAGAGEALPNSGETAEDNKPEDTAAGVSVILFSGDDPAAFHRSLPFFSRQRFDDDYEIIGVTYGKSEAGASGRGSGSIQSAAVPDREGSPGDPHPARTIPAEEPISADFPGLLPVRTILCEASPFVDYAARLPTRTILVEAPPSDNFPGRLPAWRAAVPHAAFGTLLFADAEVEPDPGYLTRMTAPLRRPETGATTAVPVSRGARTPGAALQSLVMMFLTTTFYYPAAFWGKLKTATGAGLALRRSFLDELGGVKGLPECLTSPHILARAAAGAGRSIHLVPEPVTVRRERTTLAECVSFIRSRLTLIRSFEPYLYPLFFFQTGSFHAFLLLLLFGGIGAGALLSASLVADVLSLGLLNRSFFGVRRFGTLLVPALFLALSSPAIWVSAYFGRRVRLAGRTWSISRNGAVTPYE